MVRLMPIVTVVMSVVLTELYAASIVQSTSLEQRTKRSSKYGSRVWIPPSERSSKQVRQPNRGSKPGRSVPNRASEERKSRTDPTAGRRPSSTAWNVVERKRNGRKRIRGSSKRRVAGGRRKTVTINNPNDYNELADIANSGANNYVDFEERKQADGSVKRTVVRRVGSRVGTPFIMKSECNGLICIRRRVFPGRGRG